MELEDVLIIALLLVSANANTKPEVTFARNWKEVLLRNGDIELTCLSQNKCQRSEPYNSSKTIGKTQISVNALEKETPLTEKSIDNFDEWTKKRRDAVASQNGHQKGIDSGTVVRHDEVAIPSITRPTRNFASHECGAKIIAANPEAENAKAVVNEKDVDDYMRNPCQSAKEKFIVIELCEAIQVKKIAIGNFELFASRPKTIHVFISERFPPLANWISLGSFQLQDHHKTLQTFEVPNTHVYAKFVRINLEDHYGKEHYCIVSVVNVMGSTLADEYDKEEAAAHLLNVIEEKKEEPVTTPPPSEQRMQTQLPVPPRAPNRTVHIRDQGKMFNFRNLRSFCNQCPVAKVSYFICHTLEKKLLKNKTTPSLKTTTIKPPVSDNRTLRKEFQVWAENSRHLNFEQSRRRNLASIQRFLPKETKNSEPTSSPTSVPISTVVPTAKATDSPKSVSVEDVKQAVEQTKQQKKPAVEAILPAGGSTSQREMVLMKLSKRISAVEMNLTLSTEYLSELSKQYVTQMSDYQLELKETRKASRRSAQNVEVAMRSKMNSVRRDIRDLRHSVYVLQQLENNRYKQSQNEMSRNIFMSSCHISSNVPPHPTLARLPLIIPSISGKMDNFTNFEEKIKRIYETAKSVMFGSVTWNTDHLIVALITFNVAALAVLFAGVFYTYRRNKERCEETQLVMKNELRARLAKVGVENRKMIAKGMRRAELAVTAAVFSALKIEKSSNNRKAMTELESALANLFAAQQTRIDKQFEQNQQVLKEALEGRRSQADDTMSVEDSESSSETEQPKEDTPTLDVQD